MPERLEAGGLDAARSGDSESLDALEPASRLDSARGAAVRASEAPACSAAAAREDPLRGKALQMHIVSVFQYTKLQFENSCDEESYRRKAV